MQGTEAYAEKIEKKINCLLDKNQDRGYLKGFYFFLNNSAYSTIYTYLSYVNNFIDYCNKEPGDLVLDDYTGFLLSIKGKTSSYQIAMYAALKKFSLYLLSNGANTANPMQYVSRPKYIESRRTTEKREKGYLEEEEISVYLENVEDGVGSGKAVMRQNEWLERDMLIILLLLNTGMRCSALYKLDVDSIDLNRRVLHTLDKGGKIKTYKLDRKIMKYVKEWLSRREELLQGKEEEALFISNQKTRLCQMSIARVVNKYAVDIEGKHITPHKLRATCGTQLYNATKDIYFVQGFMGHSSPKTTEIYIRGQKDTNREKASEILSRATIKN